ncbi:VOC family protein [Chitinophaga sp. SYP-B3965]|uniref:glyoxalase superfamily protein n=1 Tax=Chitinophaga sp. SYP-B3965 TaxID=2663120 RepID=UPI001299A16C|nr:glyoxalase superfamily protein [Chitinophaga sp. SYP-B3965]MRG44141.1 VOC family protein [Chitinophaga sp. SYP-B3965]
METKVIPVLRIFDYAKAKEFYIDWLGFSIEWEHRFEENFPIYMQVKKGGIVLHLTEHHGDCSPGSKVFIETTGVTEYHRQLSEKDYRYNKPGLEQAFWNAPCMEVTDPFGNKLLFTEKGN